MHDIPCAVKAFSRTGPGAVSRLESFRLADDIIPHHL